MQVVPGVTVDKGTAKNDVGLPTEVRIELDNGDQLMVDVIWDEGTPEYNKEVVDKYEFVGSLVLPDGVNNVEGIKAKTVVTVDGEKSNPTGPEKPETTEPSNDDSGKVPSIPEMMSLKVATKINFKKQQ